MATQTQEVKVITLEERELGASAALQLVQRCEPLVSAVGTTVIIDLKNIRFIDSLAVSCLVRLAQRTHVQSRLVLVGLSRYAKTVARVTHLEDVVEIYETVDQATPNAALA